MRPLWEAENGLQRYFCRSCNKYQQKEYIYKACDPGVNATMKLLVCESVDIRGIAKSRILFARERYALIHMTVAAELKHTAE
jgi:transposase-like protein